MNDLEGRVALITGTSRPKGIGFGIAQQLAALGADICVHGFTPYDRRQYGQRTERDTLLQSLRTHGRHVEWIEADLADPRAPARVMQAAVDAFDHVDVLIANHAYSTRQPLDALTAAEIDRHLSVNVRGTLLLVREFVRQHDGRPGGRVVLMTSGQHLGPMTNELAYVASKGALHQLTASLSDALIDKGITVNTVNPGPTLTWEPGDDERAWVEAHMPLGRWGTPEDAARLIGWLVSDEARWITGQVINSEGGFRRG
jgi:3-oxoacyl-[acyl-carrier protein] reductase